MPNEKHSKLREGEILGLAGESGCGKATLGWTILTREFSGGQRRRHCQEAARIRLEDIHHAKVLPARNGWRRSKSSFQRLPPRTTLPAHL